MAMTINTNFMGMPVEETIPDAAMVRGVSRSSLLTGRRRVRLQPQTGVNYGTLATTAASSSSAANSIIQFVLADSSSLLDLNSVVVHAQVCVISANNVTGGATADAALDDGPAWVRRATISLNGTNVDDTDLANKMANAFVQAGADRSWYSGAGSFSGYWATNPALTVAQSTGTASTTANVAYAVGDLSGAVISAANRYYNQGGSTGGAYMSYPLSLVSRFFATKQYLPLSQCGELVIQLLCANNSEAVFQKPGATDAVYTLQNVFLEADFVQPHYLYQEMLNKVTQLEGEQGMVIPFSAIISAQGQSVTSSGQANIVTSLATNNLRRVIVTQSLTDYLTSINYPGASCFPNNACTGLQFRVGSLYFPSQEEVNPAGMFWMLQSAFNHGEPLHQQNGCIDYNLFLKTTAPLYGYPVTSAVNWPTTATYSATTGAPNQYWGDSCVLGYGFNNYKGGEELDADGISVLGQAGSQLVTLLRIAPNTGTVATAGTAAYATRAKIGSGVTANIHLERTRYIVLRQGSLRVEGV